MSFGELREASQYMMPVGMKNSWNRTRPTAKLYGGARRRLRNTTPTRPVDQVAEAEHGAAVLRRVDLRDERVPVGGVGRGEGEGEQGGQEAHRHQRLVHNGREYARQHAAGPGAVGHVEADRYEEQH